MQWFSSGPLFLGFKVGDCLIPFTQPVVYTVAITERLLEMVNFAAKGAFLERRHIKKEQRSYSALCCVFYLFINIPIPIFKMLMYKVSDNHENKQIIVVRSYRTSIP